MGTSLSYRHELGIDYNRILPDLIVGSCLQTAEDVDRLAEQEGVTTIFSLQEDCDMAYFKLDLEPIKARCMERGDVKHVRFPIRDFDPYDLRRKLPKAVARLAREHDPKAGTVYIHCTAGMGRAPATALAYMNWIRGMQLDHAYSMLTSMRRCGPKIEAIRSATSDLLLGTDPVETTIAVHRFGQAKSIQVAGLDVGWHAPLPMEKETKPPFRFVLHRKLYPGKYQYKLIVDGNWTFSADHPTARDNNNTNNVLEVIPAKMDPMTVQTQMRLLTPNTHLTQAEQEELRAMLCPWATHNNPGDWGPTEPATLETPASETAGQ
ncbi:protein-tyrosine phosphatase-like protein [Haematococcus lacustris]